MVWKPIQVCHSGWLASCSGGRSCEVLILPESKRGNILRDQILGGPCNFGRRICLKQIKRGEHSIPFQCSVFLWRRKAKKKKISPCLLTSPSRSWNERFYASAKFYIYLYCWLLLFLFFPLLSQEYVLISETSCIERIQDCFQSS